MRLILLIPTVIRNFIKQFPETTQNAYKYFNYDNRVVEESVPRGDMPSQYQGPDDFSNADYEALVHHASSLLDPVLVKYSAKTARETALHLAIKSFMNGRFDGKVNANKFNVLVNAMSVPVTAKEKSQQSEDRYLRRETLKDLGLKHTDIPHERKVRQKGVPVIVKTDKGKIVVKK